MGLGPIMSIYQARFNKYLHNRGLKDTSQQRVWCFVGDGETDEPESLGALTLASREKLDNLTWWSTATCSGSTARCAATARSSGTGGGLPRRRLERHQVIWGSEWDNLLAQDKDGLLVKRLGEMVDGEFQKMQVESGAYIRQHIFGKYPELLKLVEHLSDDQLKRLSRGGHDPQKVFAASGRRRTTRAADSRAGQDHQGLRPGRGRRGP